MAAEIDLDEQSLLTSASEALCKEPSDHLLKLHFCQARVQLVKTVGIAQVTLEPGGQGIGQEVVTVNAFP